MGERPLKKSATESTRDRIVEIFENTNKLLEEVGEDLSEKEYMFLEETINSRALLTPKL